MILFNTSICFDIGLLSKLLDLFEKEKILEENNFNEEDIIQI
jgi:hypothetical protein